MKRAQMKTLERLGTVELIQDAITHRGGYWMWMVADRFPLDGLDIQDTPSFITYGVSNGVHTLSVGERFPLELIHMIALESSLIDLLSLASSSRVLRSMLLGSEASRNSLATAWIAKNALWYAPATSGPEPHGSMRNRARIWKVAEQIEEIERQNGIYDWLSNIPCYW
ncbi:hypothetical protein CONPUDRAFT_166815 [Coniophora puteana RWD-64-598 SS2]|uniref:F-box domain-containing protein n=1 Tax=Coniophora puteana (strain RWD-64-598) TaxID=741705 RepID=A0A5M3MIV9_CONPW|nr:uncharacterized protein CONPUDRAFT_166815 [Coniophora puteana RWD-64-598 SS2]EIW78966.1 hypothetical protein CONPUDRAFT_166815 [Coniophora puteana RWD-64-598 SS2]